MTLAYRQRILGRRTDGHITGYGTIVGLAQLKGETVAYVEWDSPKLVGSVPVSPRDTVRILDIVPVSSA